ncbi:MAG: hypothetical protein GF320_11155 [Armatimonadia bacterium]|nr:hypothetical protein [Armatimonadia bacterium]
MRSALEDTLDLGIDRHVALDVTDLERLLGLVGEVSVEVRGGPSGEGLHYSDSEVDLHIELALGTHSLGPRELVGLLRWRQDGFGQGDGPPGRRARQRTVLSRIMAAARERVGLDLATSVVAERTRSDLAAGEVRELASMVLERGARVVWTGEVPAGDPDDNVWYWARSPDPEGTAAVLAEARSHLDR